MPSFYSTQYEQNFLPSFSSTSDRFSPQRKQPFALSISRSSRSGSGFSIERDMRRGSFESVMVRLYADYRIQSSLGISMRSNG